jgi:peptidoglycan/LPS O-acetylase OafA/YrhL
MAADHDAVVGDRFARYDGKLTAEARVNSDGRSTSPKVLRTDIQSLRGFAVLVVLLFHAKLSLFRAGYLGVDVFFVISGYLITTLVRDGLGRGDFSLREFYYRRAKRLLPAAYVVFGVTALAAPFLLNEPELLDFREQLLGALSFAANIVLWRQSGYFEGAADLKPLLHVWSLSLEEQYYFVLPALLLLLPRRRWFAVLLAAVTASLAGYFVLEGRDSTFFLLPTRAWQLGLGTLGALVSPTERGVKLLRIAFWPAIVLLVLVPTIAPLPGSPSIGNLLASVATLVVLLRQHPGWGAVRPARVLSWVGDRSYALYLVHWPLFAFLDNAWFGQRDPSPPLALRLTVLLTAVPLAYLLHRFVEQPAHYATLPRRSDFVWCAALSSVVLLVIALALPRVHPPARDYASIRRINYGFGATCEFTTDFSPIPQCRNSESPELLVWGDSYAMHLVPGLAADSSSPKIV